MLRLKNDPELKNLIAECKKKGLKFGLALGSGSARGMAHIGVIQVLEAYHIPINMIAGTSIGAVVGSVYATGASVKQMKESALAMKHKKSFALFDPTIPRSGLISDNRNESYFKPGECDKGSKSQHFHPGNIYTGKVSGLLPGRWRSGEPGSGGCGREDGS
jgi:predicted acylesterase/phospholipase RssA